MAILAAAILAFLLSNASAQDANCDFNQYVQVGQTYYVYSPNYPSNYTPGVTCRWIATCPTGYNCRLDCSDVNLPNSASCSLDRLLISKTGDPQLSGAERYCGRGTVTAVSTRQVISVGLITSRQSPGGRFLCQLTAQPVATVPDNCQCGYKRSNRIVGGVETGINEYPPLAGIVDTRIFQIKCGGAIIDKRYVLTAAHCLVNQNLSNVAVVVGEHNVNTGDSPATQGFAAARFIIHPRFSPTTFDYDIGIVVLNSDIQFSDRVGPSCLPFKFTNTDFTGQNLTVIGWGTQFPGGPTSDYPMKADLQVISQPQCRTSTPSLTDRQICTFTPGKDACQDDSGGPLFYTDPATGLLFSEAIVSYGRSCASGFPGINTRVSNAELLLWITTNAQANYCRK